MARAPYALEPDKNSSLLRRLFPLNRGKKDLLYMARPLLEGFITHTPYGREKTWRAL
jgi:hypothetical protein